MTDTYPAPAHGWTCFHCGETFVKPGAAALHFGDRPSARPACAIDRGLLVELRAVERERDEWKVKYVAVKFGVPEAEVLARWQASGEIPR